MQSNERKPGNACTNGLELDLNVASKEKIMVENKFVVTSWQGGCESLQGFFASLEDAIRVVRNYPYDAYPCHAWYEITIYENGVEVRNFSKEDVFAMAKNFKRKKILLPDGGSFIATIGTRFDLVTQKEKILCEIWEFTGCWQPASPWDSVFTARPVDPHRGGNELITIQAGELAAGGYDGWRVELRDEA